MTNQQYMATVPAKDWYTIMDWLTHHYGKRYTDTRIAIIDWLRMEAMTGEWKKVHGYVTPGGAPVWVCPHCGQSEHLYGVEYPSNRQIMCRYCGEFNYYPMEKKEDAESKVADS